MKLSQIYSIIEKIAPKTLSDEYCARYDAYDNSGVLLETGEEIDKIVFSLDFSRFAIEKAIEEKAKLIITHHPAIYGKIASVCVSDFEPLGEKLNLCLKNGISVISMHLNLDCAVDGIDESLQNGVLLATNTQTTSTEIMHSVQNGGYGRAYEINAIALDEFVKNLEKVFTTERVTLYKNGNDKVEKIASFCGGGADEQAVRFAVEKGADAIVSADFKHHILALAREKGLSVIALTHYASENYGFYQFYKKISRSVSIPCVYHTDEELL